IPPPSLPTRRSSDLSSKRAAASRKLSSSLIQPPGSAQLASPAGSRCLTSSTFNSSSSNPKIRLSIVRFLITLSGKRSGSTWVVAYFEGSVAMLLRDEDIAGSLWSDDENDAMLHCISHKTQDRGELCDAGFSLS